jgi:hypothetical protein
MILRGHVIEVNGGDGEDSWIEFRQPIIRGHTPRKSIPPPSYLNEILLG